MLKYYFGLYFQIRANLCRFTKTLLQADEQFYPKCKISCDDPNDIYTICHDAISKTQKHIFICPKLPYFILISLRKPLKTKNYYFYISPIENQANSSLILPISSINLHIFLHNFWNFSLPPSPTYTYQEILSIELLKTLNHTLKGNSLLKISSLAKQLKAKGQKNIENTIKSNKILMKTLNEDYEKVFNQFHIEENQFKDLINKFSPKNPYIKHMTKAIQESYSSAYNGTLPFPPPFLLSFITPSLIISLLSNIYDNSINIFFTKLNPYIEKNYKFDLESPEILNLLKECENESFKSKLLVYFKYELVYLNEPASEVVAKAIEKFIEKYDSFCEVIEEIEGDYKGRVQLGLDLVKV